MNKCFDEENSEFPPMKHALVIQSVKKELLYLEEFKPFPRV